METLKISENNAGAQLVTGAGFVSGTDPGFEAGKGNGTKGYFGIPEGAFDWPVKETYWEKRDEKGVLTGGLIWLRSEYLPTLFKGVLRLNLPQAATGGRINWMAKDVDIYVDVMDSNVPSSVSLWRGDKFWEIFVDATSPIKVVIHLLGHTVLSVATDPQMAPKG